MRFKQWIDLNETGTSTGDIAGFSRITIPLNRRWWVSDWEEEQSGKKKKKKRQYSVPQIAEQATYKHSCVMFVLPESQKIMQWSKKNIPNDVLEGEKGRENEIHVTVLYGLHTSDSNDVKDIVKKFKPASIQFGEISKFEADKYDVIKIDVEGDILHEMNKALKKLPFTSTHPTYKPHCTLAYVEKGSCDHLLGKRNFDDQEFSLDSVVFSPVEGEKVNLRLSN